MSDEPENWPLVEGRANEHEAFIQWKGTEVCMDLVCLGCGRELHVDADFAYTVECGDCGTIHEMSAHVGYRRNDEANQRGPTARDEGNESPLPWQEGWPRGESDQERIGRWERGER